MSGAKGCGKSTQAKLLLAPYASEVSPDSDSRIWAKEDFLRVDSQWVISNSIMEIIVTVYDAPPLDEVDNQKR